MREDRTASAAASSDDDDVLTDMACSGFFNVFPSLAVTLSLFSMQ